MVLLICVLDMMLLWVSAISYPELIALGIETPCAPKTNICPLNMQISLIVTSISLSMLFMVQFRCDLTMMLLCVSATKGCLLRGRLLRAHLLRGCLFRGCLLSKCLLKRCLLTGLSVKTMSLKRMSYTMSKSISVGINTRYQEIGFTPNQRYPH